MLKNYAYGAPLLTPAVCFFFLLASTSLSAQIQLEREFIGAVAAHRSGVVENGDLFVESSFGEPLIGYAEGGDLVVTVGFHQTNGPTQLPLPSPGTEETPQAEAISVDAFPNPTVQRLVVNLGEHRERFTAVRLLSVNGTTVRQQATQGMEQIIFDQLNQLPNANYFLQGTDSEGKIHNLGTVMIVTD